MGFCCTIKAGSTELTDEILISSYLYGLGPSSSDKSDAPNLLQDFRNEVSECEYGRDFPRAAQDCFIRLQQMAAENLASLIQEKHCENCSCELPNKKPKGFDVDAIKKLLSIDSNSVTSVYGGY